MIDDTKLDSLSFNGATFPYAIFVPSGGQNLDLGQRVVVVLPGAGTANMDRYEMLGQELAARGLLTVTFDYLGQGSSEGVLKQQSLKARYEQLRYLLEILDLENRELTLVSFSMSGQTVGDVVGRSDLTVRNVVLCSPAAYAEAAWEMRFDSDFTETIRKNGSWRTSSAFGHLNNYDGYSALVLPESDTVIPAEVSEQYEKALSESSKFIKWIVPGSDHRLGGWFAEHDNDRMQLENLIAR